MVWFRRNNRFACTSEHCSLAAGRRGSEGPVRDLFPSDHDLHLARWLALRGSVCCALDCGCQDIVSTVRRSLFSRCGLARANSYLLRVVSDSRRCGSDTANYFREVGSRHRTF